MPDRPDDLPGQDWGDRDTTQYNLHIPSETWDNWADTIPRSVPLYYRIYELIAGDLRATRMGGYDEMEERTARLLASRIERRAKTARDALEKDKDDHVREHLEKIEDVASTFSE